jgi:hypothetical protein
MAIGPSWMGQSDHDGMRDALDGAAGAADDMPPAAHSPRKSATGSCCSGAGHGLQEQDSQVEELSRLVRHM